MRRYLTGRWPTSTSSAILWLNIGGRKPLAHLPRWRRHLFHLPAIRLRLWPPIHLKINGRELVTGPRVDRG